MNHVRTPDPQAMADRRQLADTLALPPECSHDICRRTGRCRGPRAESAAFPGHALPRCLASGYDALYAPVARWNALNEMMNRAEKRLAAMSLPGRAIRGRRD